MNHVELLLHNIRSVYNTAAIFRTAECLGVKKIWLSGYTPAPIDRFGRERSDFHKVALGVEQIIPWEQADDFMKVITDHRDDGFVAVALEQAANSIALQNFKARSPVLLIPGTETIGVDEIIMNSVDQIVEISQVGTKESLNVMSATAIALWQLLQ